MSKQKRFEHETLKQHAAFLIYRDMGGNRSVIGAYALYLDSIGKGSPRASNKVPSPSPSFKRWFVEFDWAGRVDDWERSKSDRIQSAQLEIDRQGYVQRIEDGREVLENTAMAGMKSAELSLAIGFEQLQKIAEISATQTLSKVDIDRLVAITRNNKDSIDTLAAAKTEIYDALGLVQTIERLGTVRPN
jgi:hypothetical protein